MPRPRIMRTTRIKRAQATRRGERLAFAIMDESRIAFPAWEQAATELNKTCRLISTLTGVAP